MMTVEIKGAILPVKICDEMISQAVGLMGRSGENALFIYKRDVRHGIHTWLCQTLQLIYLDKNKRVLETVILKPFRTHTCCTPYRYLLEISRPIKIKKGEKIYF